MEKTTCMRYVIAEKVTGRFFLSIGNGNTNEFTDDLTLAEIWLNEDRVKGFLQDRCLEEYCEAVKVQITFDEIE